MGVTRDSSSDKMADTRFRSWKTCSFVASLVLVVRLHLCLSSFSAAVLAQETTSSCHISSVKEAEPTNITCTFSADVFAAKNNIKILHFVDEDSEGAKVAYCSWIEEGLHCNTASGYEFDNQTLKHEVVIRVPQASRDQSGRYACIVPSSASTTFASCNLVVMTAGLTTCAIPSVKMLSQTSLTCYFPEDVSKTRANISVYRHSIQGPTAVDILTCNWEKEQLECTTAPEYEFNNTITDQLVIRVPRASRDHKGTYTCQVQGLESTRFAPCEFNVLTAGITTCEIPSVKLMSQTSLTCSFPEDLREIRSDFTVYHHSIQGFTDAVSSCEWKNEQLNCSTVRGYEVDGNATDHVTLKVHNISKNHEGLYNCQMTGLGSVDYENCSFQLQKDDKQQFANVSSCNISSVKETKAAELICTFSVDVNETKQSFKVTHLGHDGRKNVGVLMCIWVGDGLDCTTSPTYEFNNTVSSQLVVRIPRVSRDHSGTYACYVLSSKQDGFESCEFMVMTGRCTFTFTTDMIFTFTLYSPHYAQHIMKHHHHPKYFY